ncbi:hypothetical protein [Shimia sp. SK013]|uniref:hypothetical protein n=1 Tax=Shimia sp. SK013 TaxID=1389006 RepID=UPI00187CD2D9|nr:hypothetical protein [Shimia sp. SK013]
MMKYFLWSATVALLAVAPVRAESISVAREAAIQKMTSAGVQRVKIDRRLNGNTRLRGFSETDLHVIIIDKKTGGFVTDIVVPLTEMPKTHWADQGPDFADIEGH